MRRLVTPVAALVAAAGTTGVRKVTQTTAGGIPLTGEIVSTSEDYVTLL